MPCSHNKGTLPSLTGGVLELVPAPVLAGIEGNFVSFTCGPQGMDSIDLLVNGILDNTIRSDNSTGNLTFTVGPLTRAMSGTTFQCEAGTLMSEITTLLTYCESQC